MVRIVGDRGEVDGADSDWTTRPPRRRRSLVPGSGLTSVSPTQLKELMPTAQQRMDSTSPRRRALVDHHAKVAAVARVEWHPSPSPGQVAADAEEAARCVWFADGAIDDE